MTTEESQAQRLEKLEAEMVRLQVEISALRASLESKLNFYRGVQIGDEESLRWLWQLFLELDKKLAAAAGDGLSDRD